MREPIYFPQSQPLDIPIVENISEQIYENETKVDYLTILSKYRNSDFYPSPAKFSISLKQNEDSNEDNNTDKHTIKVLDKIIFKNTSSNETIVDIKHINNILSVECLDVVLPNNKEISREPYLWLCIDEWGSSNIGTGVPEGAFARLKMVPNYEAESPFITMRAHILERQHPELINEKLTISLLTSDGEPIQIEDRIEVEEVNRSIDNDSIEQGIIKVSGNIEKIKPDDKLYFYSLYNNDVIGFYPNVYIHDIKVKGEGEGKDGHLSLRLFVDKDPDDTDNRIGKFINKNTKERIVSSKYLSVGDLLFLEYMKTKKVSGKFKIIDIKDDIITINFPQTKRKFVPKKITKIGFIKKKNEGYVSQNKEDLNYKGGINVKKIEGDKIYLDFKGVDGKDNFNKYFFLNRKKQTSYMFRITYI